jgi:hypothetical protein
VLISFAAAQEVERSIPECEDTYEQATKRNF